MGWGVVDSFLGQLAYTARKLSRAPLFTTVAILTLAVGIGSNTAIFSVVNGVLLKPLPFENPETLVGIWHTAPGLGFDQVNQSPALHFTYASEGRSFESVGMWDQGQASVTGLEEPEQVDVMYITHQIMPMTGVGPFLGRRFSEEDDSPGTPQTVIVSHGFWQRRFGGDHQAIGQALTVDGSPMEIIGVMPEGSEFLRWRPDLYLPFQFDPAEVFVGNFSYQAMGRLLPGTTIDQANADIDRMALIALERYPGGMTRGMFEEAGFAGKITPLKRDVVGDVGSTLWVLLGTVAMILLIACANVANLFIVRAEGRQREMAVRTAMGAGRAQVAGQLFMESIFLGVAGGAAGLVLAFGGLKLLVALGPESLPRLSSIGIDSTVLGFTMGISVLAGILFGLFPALRYGTPHLVEALKEGGRGGSASKERHAARNALVVVQMALALVLLTGSGLMMRSFQELQSVNPGFTDPEEVLTFRVTIPTAEIEDPAQVALAHQEILRRVQAIPGVLQAGFSSSVALDGWDSNDGLEMEDDPVAGDAIPPIRRFKWIGEGYHATMGTPLLAGRSITWSDVQDRAHVAVVTEDLAREYWSTPAEALGRRVRVFGGNLGNSEWREIVGVVGAVHDDGVSQDAVATVYWPQVVTDFWGEEITTRRSLAYAVRTRTANPQDILPEVRNAVWSVNGDLPLARVNTLSELVADSMGRTSFTLIMLGIAAAVALFLGAVGIHGVISYVVSQRTREIGVRMAMGAERADVSGMVMRQALLLAAGGVLVGLAAAAGLTRLMASLLYGVSPMDPLTFGGVAVALSSVALVASYIPARRAAAVDPVVALRAEL
jgi:predicted permease